MLPAMSTSIFLWPILMSRLSHLVPRKSADRTTAPPDQHHDHLADPFLSGSSQVHGFHLGLASQLDPRVNLDLGLLLAFGPAQLNL